MQKSKPGFTPQGLATIFLSFILYQFGHNVLAIAGLEMLSFILVSLLVSGFLELKAKNDPGGLKVVFPKRVFVNEIISVRYLLEDLGGASWSGLNLNYRNKKNKKIKTFVSGGDQSVRKEGVLGSFTREKRGICKGLDIDLVWKDCFGLVSRSLSFQKPEKIIIYPQKIKINIDKRTPVGFGLPFSGEDGSAVDREGTSQDFFGIRKYVFGDSLKKIDRTSSEKTGNLMVKKFHHHEGVGAYIRLSNRGWESSLHWENAIAIAASWASFWSSKKFPIGFFYEGDDVLRIPPAQGEAVLERIFYNLAVLPKGFSKKSLKAKKNIGNSLFILPSKTKIPSNSLGILVPKEKIPKESPCFLWKKSEKYWIPEKQNE